MPIGYTFCCICSRCGHEWVPKRTEQLALPRGLPEVQEPQMERSPSGDVAGLKTAGDSPRERFAGCDGGFLVHFPKTA